MKEVLYELTDEDKKVMQQILALLPNDKRHALILISFMKTLLEQEVGKSANVASFWREP